MTTKKETRSSGTSFQDALTHFATRLEQSKVARKGQIVFNLPEQEGGRHFLTHDAKGVSLQASVGMNDMAGTPPLLEVFAEKQVIQDILEGRKDPLRQFAGGKLRIRGDLRYFSDLAMELELINKPL